MFPLVLPSDQDCSDYRANGFTVFPRFADVSEVDILTAEIERLAASWTTESLFGCVRDRFGVPVVMNRLDKQSDVLYDLARHPRLTLTAERLLGRAAISLHVEYFANTGTAVPAHQDHRSYYDHFRDEAAVALWIALDDIQANSGGLEFGRPYHERLLPHVESSAFHFDCEVASLEGLTFERVQVERGGCIAHDSYSVHRTQPNTSGRPRRAVVFNYRSSSYRASQRAYQSPA